MNLKKLWVYLVILLVIAGFLAATRFFRPQAPREEKNPLLFPLSAAALEEVQWKRGEEIIRIKKGKGWEIVTPLALAADTPVLEEILQGLTGLRPERVLTEPIQNLKEFGLDSPGLIISYQAQGKGEEIRIGAKNAVGNAFYVKTSRSPSLFLVDSSQIKELDRDLFALRSKKIFSFASEQIHGFEISSDGKRFFLEKGSKGWISKEKPNRTLAKEKVASFLSDLLLTQAKGFAEPGEEEPDWGFKKPRLRIRLLGGEKEKKEETLIIGAGTAEKGLPTRSPIHRETLFLDPGFIKKIPQGPEVWEEKNEPAPAKKGP